MADSIPIQNNEFCAPEGKWFCVLKQRDNQGPILVMEEETFWQAQDLANKNYFRHEAKIFNDRGEGIQVT